MSVRALLAGLAALATLVTPSLARAQSSPSDYTYATRYDAARRVVGTIAPDPDGSGAIKFAATRTTYDGAGDAIRVEKGELSSWQSESVLPKDWPLYTTFTVQSQIDTTYDAMGRKLTEKLSSGGTPYSLTQYSYDNLGRLECTAQRLNPAGWGSLPSSACALGTAGTYGADRITRQVYDAAGQVLRVQKAYGTPLQQDYVTYTYSANGKPLSVKDANGNVAGYTYDGFDRLAKWAFPDKTSIGSISSNDYEAYTYDPNGNRTSLRKRDGRTLSYSYDALNRVTVKVIPDSCVPGYACTTPPANAVRDVFYGYDLRGLQTFARFDSVSGSDAVSASYDGFGRQASETLAMAGTSRTVGYQYDADGNRVRITWPDSAYFSYGYDGLDRASSVLLSGTTSIATMTYDARGQQAGETRGNVATTFGYDPVSRLSSLADDLSGTTSDITSTFAYSPASQLIGRTRSNTAYAWNGYTNVSRAYAVNGLNQYTTAGAVTFGYDANGNLASDGTSGYTYDAENRLVADQAGTTLTYDPLGRLYAVATATTTETYLYAGDQRIAEYDAGGTMTARYVPGGGSDNPLIWYTGSATTAPRPLQGDERGSIASVADASGAMLSVNSYDEYGIPASGNLGRYGYTGQLWVPQLGLWYYKARLYSPTLGRFMQTDPIGYADQNNLYAYVGGDPMNNSDPTGQQQCWTQYRVRIETLTYKDGHQTRKELSRTALGSWCDGPESKSAKKAARSSPKSTTAKVNCEKFTTDGKICILRRDENGNLQSTEEWTRITCANASAIRDAGSAINDTVGFPPVANGAGAVGAAVARRGGLSNARAAGAGGAVSLYAWFVGVVAQSVTGQGWRPFGVQVVPKAEPSGCLR